jgi:hypothetical protein
MEIFMASIMPGFGKNAIAGDCNSGLDERITASPGRKNDTSL